MNRSLVKQFGVNLLSRDNSGGSVLGSIGRGNPGTIGTVPGDPGTIDPKTGLPAGSTLVTFNNLAGGTTLGLFGKVLGLDLLGTLDLMENDGVITTLAEPNLTALSGETASFLAGGEFPIPVSQGNGGNGGGTTAITVEYKSFGVSLAFTPTVLADGVINLVVAPEVSSIDPSASVVINNLTIPGLQTRRAKTTVELRDGESFALAGLIRKDFQDTIRQVPLVGSLPILGALFRSTGFQHEQTELVIIVTPRLVRPVPAGSLKVPTDRVGPPNEADLLLNGRIDTGVPPAARSFVSPPATLPPPPPPPAAAAGTGGMAEKKPMGFEKDYGHVL